MRAARLETMTESPLSEPRPSVTGWLKKASRPIGCGLSGWGVAIRLPTVGSPSAVRKTGVRSYTS